MSRWRPAAASAGEADAGWMGRALVLAARGEGRTRPNPPVGAVVVDARGTLVGEGWHRRAGGPHAEVFALRQSGARARGGTLYVTLEPCSTHGRTPPCTEAVATAGIARVVAATRDPNPRHAGRGLRLLRRRGVAVEVGLMGDEAARLLAPFRKWVLTGRPRVTLKLGMTLDGRIADAAGRSRWITGPAARARVQDMRRRADAVLVGARTVLADDPSLLWRGRGGRGLRIVVDTRGVVPVDRRIFTDGQAGRTIVATTVRCAAARRRAYEAAGAQVWVLPAGRGGRGVSLPRLMARAGEEGLLHILCEGGGELAASLARGGLVDDYVFFVAPSLLGGGALPVIGGEGWTMDDKPALCFTAVERVGRDVMIRAEPAADGGKRDVHGPR
jgi:diaminohydroxyphosphoribosylaminopyrimidine deaminase/5-amino-6-(5-phosphoribosylamino)uracil reductase